MTTYYRFTESQSPMSNWGHAMFAEKMDSVEHYGKNLYTLNASVAVNVEDLKESITAAWEACKENEYFGSTMDTYYEQLTAEEVYNLLNPADIVNSAEGYDCDIVQWFWDYVLEPQGIMAVRTQDGAVCFDETLIEKGVI